MKDNFKDLFKNLPQPASSKEGVNRLVTEIIKRELNLLWEKRISILSAISSLILGYLTIRQVVAVAGGLDTMGFWAMVGADSNWLLKDTESFWPAFLEANPLKEIGFLLLLVFLLTFSVKIFLKASRREELFMRKSKVVMPLIGFLMIVTGLTAAWVFSSNRETAFPTSLEVEREPGEEPTVEPTVATAISPGATPSGTKIPTPSLAKSKIEIAFFLELLSPEDGMIVNIARIEVKGRTIPGSEVFVNEEQVYPDQAGNFRKEVVLQEGENYILVTAGNGEGDSEIERVVYFER